MSIRSDPELMRAHWRKMSYNRYHRLLETDPEGIRAEKREQGRRWRLRHRKPRPIVPMSICAGCWTPFRGDKGQRFHDRPCYYASKRSCPIRIQTCEDCGSPFTAHGKGLRKFCSRRCGARRWQREYQRRTRLSATRYWQVDATPEAQEVARLYYQLRQHLRGVRHGNRQGGPDPSGRRSRNHILAR